MHSRFRHPRSYRRAAVATLLTIALELSLPSCFGFALGLRFGLGLMGPDRAAARTLPQHCSDLIQGDCDDAWECVVACFMEITGLDSFCSQNPDSPQCR